MEGKDGLQQVYIDQIINVLIDIKNAMTVQPMYVTGDLKSLQNIIYERFEKVARYLGEKPFLVGELSVADFYFAEMVHIAMYFTENQLGERFPNLKTYYERYT